MECVCMCIHTHTHTHTNITLMGKTIQNNFYMYVCGTAVQSNKKGYVRITKHKGALV